MLVIGTLFASLIQGAAAMCMSSTEIGRAYQAEIMKVSVSCMTAMGQTGGAVPPNCGSVPSCGVDISYNLSFTCTGSACSLMPVQQPRTMALPQQQQCVPAACQNTADGSIIMGALNMSAMNGMACGMSNSSQSSQSQGGVQMGTKVSWEKVMLTCNGQVVAIKNRDSSSTMGGAPKLDTCMDVKTEYKRQGCCTMPTKMFNMGDKGMQSGGRRLSQDTLMEDMRLMLEEAKMQGGAAHAGSMAADLISFIEKATP